MNNSIEERLVEQLPVAADLILTGAVAPAAAEAASVDRGRASGPGWNRFALLGALAVGLVAVVATVSSIDRGSPTDVITAASSTSVRTDGLDSNLYFMATDVMAPALPSESRVQIFDLPDSVVLERGDLVLVADDGEDALPHIKRVIGLPFETVNMSGMEIRIDGSPLIESWVTTGPGVEGGFDLAANEFLVMPDDRSASEPMVVQRSGLIGWAPVDTTAIVAVPEAERPAALAEFLACVGATGVDTTGLPADPAEALAALGQRIPDDSSQQFVADLRGCMMNHAGLFVDQ